MVDYIKNGKNFSKNDGTMLTCYREIYSDDFDRLAALNPKERIDEIESSLDKSILCGYGVYGCGITVHNARFYVWYKRGLSCD